jgi:hypothetical protein
MSMKTRTDLPIRVGTGTARKGHDGKTVSDQDIPEDNKKFVQADDEITEGALPPEHTKPKTSRLDDRPSRGMNNGLHR